MSASNSTSKPSLGSRWQHLRDLERELAQPTTPLGQRYMVLIAVTIVASIFFLFLVDEYPALFPPTACKCSWSNV
jgi:hypothetical protein